jgi:CRISPR-associated protein Cas2
MQGYGKRAQYSVFRCHLTERDVARLRWDMSRIMQQEDELLIVRLCNACIEKVEVLSTKASWPKEEMRYEVL